MSVSDFVELYSRKLPEGLHPYLHQADLLQTFLGSGSASNEQAFGGPGPKKGQQQQHQQHQPPVTLPANPPFTEDLGFTFSPANVWLSPRGVETDSHYDSNDNLIMMLNGTKDVLLYPPHAIEALGVKPSHQLSPGEVPPADIVAMDEGASRAHGFKYRRDDGQRPPLDYLNPTGTDARAFAEWADKHACRAVLKPGSMLYIPVFWMHAVHGFQNGVGDGNDAASGLESGVASVNLWFATQAALERGRRGAASLTVQATVMARELEAIRKAKARDP